MNKLIFSIGIISMISKLTGFGRELALSYYFGASELTDAYLVAISIPTVIFNFIGLGLMSSFIPIYSTIKQEEGEKEAFNFSANFLNFLLIICTIFIIVGLWQTNNIVKIFASGFDEKLLNITVFYTRICLIGVYFIVISSIFIGLLQVHDKFYIASSISIPMNFIYIVGCVVAYRVGSIYLIVFSVLAMFSQVLLLLYPIKKIGYKHNFKLRLEDKNLKNIILLSIPTIIGASLEQINYLVDKTIASRIIIGGISILNYASRLNIAMVSILLTTLLAVLFPKISLLVTEKKYDLVQKNVVKSAIWITLISFPFISIIMIFSREIVGIIFGRGSFNHNDINMTASCLSLYTLGFLGMALRELVIRVFYAFKDTKTPVMNSGIGIIINIILSILLSKYMGLNGVVLATSISLISMTLLLTINLKKKYGDFGFKKIGTSFFKIFVATLVMSSVIFLLKYFFSSFPTVFLLGLGIIFGILVYLLLLFFMKIEEYELVVMGLKTRILKKKITK